MLLPISTLGRARVDTFSYWLASLTGPLAGWMIMIISVGSVRPRPLRSLFAAYLPISTLSSARDGRRRCPSPNGMFPEQELRLKGWRVILLVQQQAVTHFDTTHAAHAVPRNLGQVCVVSTPPSQDCSAGRGPGYPCAPWRWSMRFWSHGDGAPHRRGPGWCAPTPGWSSVPFQCVLQIFVPSSDEHDQ